MLITLSCCGSHAQPAKPSHRYAPAPSPPKTLTFSFPPAIPDGELGDPRKSLSLPLFLDPFISWPKSFMTYNKGLHCPSQAPAENII